MVYAAILADAMSAQLIVGFAIAAYALSIPPPLNFIVVVGGFMALRIEYTGCCCCCGADVDGDCVFDALR